jgi:trimeric autotransporter adhesin
MTTTAMTVPTIGIQLVRIAGAALGKQMSASEYSEVLTANKTAADLAVWANAAVATAYKGQTTADISKAVLANVGLSTVPGLDAWLTGQLNGGGGFANAGATLIGLLNDYAKMSTTEAIYGASVVTFNTKVENSQAASQKAGTAAGTYAAVSSMTAAQQAAADKAAADKKIADDKAAADKAAADKVAADKAAADQKAADDKAAADKAAADKIVADQAAADALAKEAAAAVFTTSAADNIVGTDSAITYSAVRSAISTENTLSGTDKLDGGAGTDELKVDLKSSFGGFSTGAVKNVETITLNNTTDVARSFDATGVVGASTYNLDSKTGVSVTNADTLGTVNVLNRASGTTTVDFDDTKISTTTDNTLNLGVSALGSGATTFVTVTAPDIQKMTVTSSGAASNVDLAGAPLKSVTVKGASDISLKATGVATLTTIDASEVTGKVTLSGLAGTISSLKTGSADDTVTATAISTTAVLSGGIGTDSLTLSTLAAGTYQPTMTGFETLNVSNSAGAVVLSMTKSTDVANLVVDTLGGALTMSKAGAGDLKITSKGAQAANTISNDTTGKVSFATVVADKTTTTTNDTNALSVTASKSSSLSVDVVKFTNATGTFTAANATEVKLNAAGGFTGAISAAKATDLTITGSESIALAAGSDLSSVSTLSATTSKNLDLSNGGLTAVGTMTAAGTGSASTLTFGALGGATNTQAIALTASGWKGGTNLILGVDSQDSIKLDFTGTTGAVAIGAIGGGNGTTTPTGSVTINATGALGTVTQTGNITVGANKSITVTAKDSIANVTLGNLSTTASSGNLTGAITVDASGSIATVGLAGTFSAKAVTIDVSGGLNAVTPGVITTITEVFTGNSSADNTRGDTANNLTYTGGTGVDALTILHRDSAAGSASTAAIANEETHALNISTGANNDVLIFNMYPGAAGTGQTKATYTGKIDLGENTSDTDALTFNGVATSTVMDLQGLTVTGADAPVIINGVAAASLIHGTPGADSITAGTGVDTVNAGTGDDIIVVTNDTDLDTGEILSGGFGSDTLHLVAAATYDLNNLDATVDNLVGEAGIENLVVAHTAVTLDTANSGTALRINKTGASLTITMTQAAGTAASTLDLSKFVTSVSDTIPGVTEVALVALGDGFAVTGNAGANTILLSGMGDLADGGAGVDTITGGAGDDVITVTLAADLGVDEVLTGGASLVNGDTLWLREAAAYDLTRLSSTADNLVGEAGIENLIVNHTAVTLDEAISGTALNINSDGADTVAMTIAMTGTTLNLSNLVFTVLADVSAATETALVAGNDSFQITGSAAADTITLSSLGDVVNGGLGADTITGGAGADAITGGGGIDTLVFRAEAANGIDAITLNEVDGIAAVTDIFNLTALSAISNGAVSDIVIVNDADLEAGATAFGAAGDNIIILTGAFVANAAALSALTFDGFAGFDTGKMIVIYSSTNIADARIAIVDVAAGGDISGAVDIATLVGLNVVEASTGLANANFIMD